MKTKGSSLDVTPSSGCVFNDLDVKCCDPGCRVCPKPPVTYGDVSDPIERIVAGALDACGIRYVIDGKADTKQLDFLLRTDPPIYIECKAYHTDRIAVQTARVDNVIVIQGKAAAEWFAKTLQAKR